MIKLSEGAESELYASEFAGIDAVIKHRQVKDYRVKILDEKIRIERTKKEARLISAANASGVATPHVLLVEKYNIWMERINGKTLNQIIREGNPNLKDVFHLAGSYLGLLHSADIAHGDYTPANIMLDNLRRLYIIDFGLGERTNSVEDKALDLLLMKRSISRADYSSLIKGYSGSFKDHEKTIGRLSNIEKRGRYNTRTLQNR